MKNLLIVLLVLLNFNTFAQIECDKLELWYDGKMIASERVQDFVTVDIPSKYIRFNIGGKVFYEQIKSGENPYITTSGKIWVFQDKIIVRIRENTFKFMKKKPGKLSLNKSTISTLQTEKITGGIMSFLLNCNPTPPTNKCLEPITKRPSACLGDCMPNI